MLDVARPLDWLLEAGYDGPDEIEVMALALERMSEHLIEVGA